LIVISLGPLSTNLLLDEFSFHVPVKFGFVCAAEMNVQRQNINAIAADLTQIFFIGFAPRLKKLELGLRFG